VIARAARARIVLLGEDHDRALQHDWERDVIAALHATAPRILLGFEMFRQVAQPALDRWVAGVIDEDAFLAETAWRRTWGFPPDLYRPLFGFARLHGVPMVGLNVSHALVARVAREGWAAVPPAEREGVSDPAPPSPGYRAVLAEAHAAHPAGGGDDTAALERFIEAQLTWDRAMAEAIVRVLAVRPDALVVAVMGRGHVERGDGVPAQLAALGAPEAVTLVAWEPERDCAELVPGLATWVFGMPAAVR
jgi:uncharacterized iron-regulated protein